MFLVLTTTALTSSKRDVTEWTHPPTQAVPVASQGVAHVTAVTVVGVLAVDVTGVSEVVPVTGDCH